MSRLLRGPMRRSASLNVQKYASVGLPSLGPLATAAQQALSGWTARGGLDRGGRHKNEFLDAARAAGKDPAQMPVCIEKFVVVGDRKDAEQAAELWRFLPKAWDPYFDIRDPAEIEARANKEVPLKEVIAQAAVGTKPDVHLEALEELFDSGATEVHIHSGQPDQQRVIDFYGAEVLPRLRKAQAGQKG